MAGINDPLADAVPALRNNPVLPNPYAEYIGNRAMGVGNGVLGWEESSQFQLTYDVFLSTPSDLYAAVNAILGTAQRIGTPGATYVSMFYGQASGGSPIIAGGATLVSGSEVSPNRTWIPGFWVGKTVFITGGTGAGASGNITANLTSVLSLNNLVGWPAGGLDATSTYFIGTPYYINRTLPMRFPWPYFQHMVASRVTSVQFYRFKGKAAPGGGLPNFANWNRARITVAFEAKPYPIFNDYDLKVQFGRFGLNDPSPPAALTNMLNSPQLYAQGGYEVNRYLEIRPTPSVYAITRQAGSFQFSEGPGAAVPVNTGTSQQLGNIALEYIWYQVPEASLFPTGSILSSGGYAQNQLAIQATLNIKTFGGFGPGLLLVSDPKIEPMPAPFMLQAAVESTHRLWKVTVRAKYFNPQLAPLTQGWNTVPYVGDAKWYAIVSITGAPAGSTLYQYQDLNYAFTSL